MIVACITVKSEFSRRNAIRWSADVARFDHIDMTSGVIHFEIGFLRITGAWTRRSPLPPITLGPRLVLRPDILGG